ncbi:MAG: hypothetical protein ABW205_12210 [Burkholderiales bacterium]
MATMIPETPPDYDRARVIERPDGFYWEDKDTDHTYGPFASLWEAIEDMKYSADADYDPEETLDVQEAEIGVVSSGDDGPSDEDGLVDFDRL